MRGLPVESLIVSAPMATRSKAAAEKRISIGDTLTAVFSHYKNGAKTLIPAAIIVFAIPVAAIGCPFDSSPPETFTGLLPVRHVAPDLKKSTAPPSGHSMRLS